VRAEQLSLLVFPKRIGFSKGKGAARAMGFWKK
jgi:hypothetical protein